MLKEDTSVCPTWFAPHQEKEGPRGGRRAGKAIATIQVSVNEHVN